VKNLDTEVSLEEFNEIFAKFGSITSAVITTDENGNSKVKREVLCVKCGLFLE
jgi:polyadenylate-binding protein